MDLSWAQRVAAHPDGPGKLALGQMKPPPPELETPLLCLARQAPFLIRLILDDPKALHWLQHELSKTVRSKDSMQTHLRDLLEHEHTFGERQAAAPAFSSTGACAHCMVGSSGELA